MTFAAIKLLVLKCGVGCDALDGFQKPIGRHGCASVLVRKRPVSGQNNI
jgi:hypothetical protein